MVGLNIDLLIIRLECPPCPSSPRPDSLQASLRDKITSKDSRHILLVVLTHVVTRKHVGDDYFLGSGDKIRFFFEVDAFGPDGKLNRPKELSVNKMGHALHELDPAFREVTLQNERLKQLARELDFHKDPVVLQSMVIFKQPGIGGDVPEHNDSTFLVSLRIIPA